MKLRGRVNGPDPLALPSTTTTYACPITSRYPAVFPSSFPFLLYPGDDGDDVGGDGAEDGDGCGGNGGDGDCCCSGDGDDDGGDDGGDGGGCGGNGGDDDSGSDGDGDGGSGGGGGGCGRDDGGCGGSSGGEDTGSGHTLGPSRGSGGPGVGGDRDGGDGEFSSFEGLSSDVVVARLSVFRVLLTLKTRFHQRRQPRKQGSPVELAVWRMHVSGARCHVDHVARVLA